MHIENPKYMQSLEKLSTGPVGIVDAQVIIICFATQCYKNLLADHPEYAETFKTELTKMLEDPLSYDEGSQ